MARIIFSYTPRSIYASQGGEPSCSEGYDIWLDSSLDYDKTKDTRISLDWLGFSPMEEFNYWVSFYKANNDEVFVAKLD
jgi:hypothetical protein